PWVAGLWPSRAGGNDPAVAGLGTLGWVLVAQVCFQGAPAALLALVVAPVVPVVIAAVASREPGPARLANVHLLLALAASVATLVEARAFSGGPVPMVFLALLAGLAVAAVAVLAGVLRGNAVQHDDVADLGGVLVAGFVGVALGVVAPRLVPDFPDAARTAAIAVTGLALIVAGLRIDRATWRHLGLAGIAVAAGKVLVLDTAGATLAGRALSFIGLGAVLILGAFAYSRAQRRAGKATPPATDAMAQPLGCSR
ncbi:MAG: DUF2339 domain-containing protein, partial [Myxococcota bacterium]